MSKYEGLTKRANKLKTRCLRKKYSAYTIEEIEAAADKIRKKMDKRASLFWEGHFKK